jgi:hypothetical protein
MYRGQTDDDDEVIIRMMHRGLALLCATIIHAGTAMKTENILTRAEKLEAWLNEEHE